MKAIYLDCFSGISGNMLLGAFLQAGVPLSYLQNELAKVIKEEYLIKVSPVKKCGIAAVYVDVKTVEMPVFEEVGKEKNTYKHHPHHRTMADIEKMIEKSSLSDKVKQTSIKIFTELAKAEAKVHGTTVEEVHFHEVGAVDSIVDIVGIAISLDYLAIEKIFVSSINTGSGIVSCAHGEMMVPAPATAELLLGYPTYHKEEGKELTTPTGAAVIKALATYAVNLPSEIKMEKIAYGAGTWDLKKPNVLRVFFGDCPEKTGQKLYLIETNIDDMDTRLYGYVFEQLFAIGALDVWTTSILMKKNRPANKLSILVDEEKKESCIDLLFKETTSLGIRITLIDERREAIRRIANVETPYGDVSCKVSVYKGEIVSLSAEYEDCRRIAIEKEIPLKRVKEAALFEMKRRLGE